MYHNWAVGYAFITVYRTTVLKTKHDSADNTLLVSIITGFIIYLLMSFVPLHVSSEIDFIGILCCSIIFAYVIGKIQSTCLYERILDKLHIWTTSNTFIWDDIMDQEYPMKLCIHSKDRIYEGYPQYIEGDQRTPVISLAKFRILSLDNDVLEIGNTNQIIVVDSSKADYIEVTYYDSSAKCERLVSLWENDL